uniref:F-box/FBD/LRR-repeat protein n=1 Tax=Noccaea caerulescens TaxID=107243 RepID=A0A1J3F8J6_NOCCA
MSLRLSDRIKTLELWGQDLSLSSSLVKDDESRNIRGEDRISLLPESLLCHILSFLTTKEAVCTSVLSSRWKNIWKWAPTLELETADFTNDEACVGFIHHKLRNFQSLREFNLCINSSKSRNDAALYEPCLGKLINRKIRRLVVDCYRNIEIPLTLASCKALVCLSLYCVKLNDFESLHLPCLEIMYLEEVVFPPRGDNNWFLDTPRLEYLTLIDNQFKSFKIICMSDSVKVDIDVDFELKTHHDLSERNIVYNLLKNFSAVGVLTLSWQTLKLIYRLRQMNPLPKFHGLTRLRAIMSLNASLEVLPMVLESCPNLKHLSLELVNDDDLEAVVTKLSDVHSFCLVSSLEYVEMESPVNTDEATEEKLVRYFLENARSLKKLSKSSFVTV